MFSLTPQERKALLFISILIITGSTIRLFHLGSGANNTCRDLDSEIIKNTASSDNINNKININVVSQEKLKEIPGVGSVIAARIVEYRQSFGLFKGLEDLKKVKGIGDKKAEAMKGYIIF